MDQPEADRAARLHQLAETRAPAFAEAVAGAASASKSERQFQNAVDRLLAEFATEAGVELLFRGEYVLASGRADAVYNRLILEYEPPGSLRTDMTHARTAHAVQQVKNYIDGLARRERRERAKLLGVVFDGFLLIYVRWRQGGWRVEPAEPWTDASSARLLGSLVALASGRALTPDNIVADFGSDNPQTQVAIQSLYTALDGHKDDLAAVMYQQWRTFFAEVSGFESGSEQDGRQPELARFARTAGREPGSVEIPRLLFATHTYFSFLAKSIAILVLHRYAEPGLAGKPLGVLAELDQRSLSDELERIEDGGVFRELGFTNLLEGDFFGWYLRAWTPEVADALRGTLHRLSDYDPSTIEEDQFAARDLLKMLYHRLLPREIRHDLGEFYTPDWLAERLLNQLGEPLFIMPGGTIRQIDFSRRLLDPACGSGTFLVLAIRAFKEHARRAGMSSAETVDAVLNSVVGIDLNPLAVLAARVGYLLAIADLLPTRKGDVAIPVYLADSIVTPTTGASLFQRGRRMQTVVGSFPVPISVNSASAITFLTDILHQYVHEDRHSDDFVARVSEELTISDEDKVVLRELFALALGLNHDNRDGIWARIVKNAFMPLFIGRFDVVAGNPPWVNWESLPESYRAQTGVLWTQYGLFVHTGMDTILGKGKKDISMLMTCVAADRFLAPKGKLGFIITQAVFKTAGAGQGFRRFRLPDGEPLAVVHVDDMSELQPFEGATNSTSVVILRKGTETSYPVPYTYWRKTARGRGLGYGSTLEEVWRLTMRMNLLAEPVDPNDATSPWMTARPAILRTVRRVIGQSDYQAREGVNTGGANGVYWLDVLQRRGDGRVLFQNLTSGAKRVAEQVTAEIEGELVFPLLRPRDLRRWHAEPSAHILLVQDLRLRRGIAADELETSYPLTYAYLKRFETLLRQRAALKRYYTRRVGGRLVESGPFYSMFNAGPYTMSPFKVVFNRIASDISAAVITQEIIPQETITFVPVESEEEACYVCALLNSLPFRCAAIAYSQTGGKSFGSPHLLQNLRIPRFNQARAGHQRLAECGAAAGNSPGNSQGIEGEIDRAAADLWDVDLAHLEQLRIGLRELQSPATGEVQVSQRD